MMYRLVYTSNSDMEKHVGSDFTLYIESVLTAINPSVGKGFTTSKIVDSTALMEGGVIVKTKNSVYIFAYIK
jgi:hypothetical protein